MLAYHTVDPEACATEIRKAWKVVWAFLESPDTPIRKAAAQSLNSITQCITPAIITAAVKEVSNNSGMSPLNEIVAQSTKALESLAYARSIPEVLAVISSLIAKLHYRESSSSPTAAESLLLPTIRKISDLRIQKGFEFKEVADASLATAMRVIGPQVLLHHLPLNLNHLDG